MSSLNLSNVSLDDVPKEHQASFKKIKYELRVAQAQLAYTLRENESLIA